MDRTRQADVSLEALKMLERFLDQYIVRAVDAESQIRRDFENRVQALLEIKENTRNELERRQADYDGASGDEEADSCLRALCEAEERYEVIRMSIKDVESHLPFIKAREDGFADILSRLIPHALNYLRQKVEQLQKYVEIQLGDSIGDGVSDRHNAPTLHPEKRTADGCLGSLFDYPLPRGYRWVSLGEIDLTKQLDGVGSPKDFTKVPYETVVHGFERLKTEILPALKDDPNRRSDFFREIDCKCGRDYSEGLQRVYEAFFGQRDYIYFVKRPDGGLELINGRHRLKVALDLGWEAIPAQVRE